MKQNLLSLLRALNLLHFADRINFMRQQLLNLPSNRAFRKNFPDISLPPDYLMYESFSLNYEQYYVASRNASEAIADTIKKHLKVKDNLSVLDWGCGPGRIIRHMSDFFPNASLYGTDPNNKSINWCQENLNGTYNTNSLEPPLRYDDNAFDVIYGISIFTHLSEEMHHAWMAELLRVLKPGGIMYQTTHGDATKIRLNSDEVRHFDDGNIVVRGKVVEGHRIYTAYQPARYMNNLINSHGGVVFEHISPVEKKRIPPKDIWLITK